VEKSSNPFYGEEFQCEVPIRFRFLSFYLCEKTNKQDKVLGKVQLKKEELHRYHNRDHWFPLRPVDANTEVQGKVHLEIKFDEHIGHGSPNSTKHRLSVRVLEGQDLSVMNGSCNPYATVSLLRGRGKPKDEMKKTCTKKKTQSPSYDEVFYFDIEKKGQNHDRNGFNGEVAKVEISVSLWHDDSRMSQLGIFPAVFLGEVKIPLKDLDVTKVHQAWYFLQPRSNRQSNQNVGSLRVKICFNADHVFPAEYYDDLRELLLQSPSVQPITSSLAYLLGEVVESKEEAAHPLVRVFHDQGLIVQLISTLADWEISKTTDPNTIFRGNTLASKCIDELMKLVGRHYLQDTLKEIIDQVGTFCV
jgi:Ras GTPase-activating protein 3